MRGGRQVVRVIAQPQRGHCVAVPAQVVPQEEQVLVQLEQLPHARPRPFTQERLHEQPVFALAVVDSSHADFGKSGRENNSSHTFSANSSQGGTEQKP